MQTYKILINTYKIFLINLINKAHSHLQESLIAKTSGVNLYDCISYPIEVRNRETERPIPFVLDKDAAYDG